MATLDFTKLPSNQRVSVWLGATGPGIGIDNVNHIEAVELNTYADSLMLPAAPAISWNDWGFGMEASEVQNEPSLADSASYEEFGQSNYGGEISYYYPEEYDDDSNLLSQVYDLTDKPSSLNDIVVRIDGDVKHTEPAQDGDFVSGYRVSGEGETNPFTPGEAKRRTVTYWNKSDFSHYSVVGPQTLTAIPPTTAPWADGNKARIQVSQGGRDVTCKLRVRSTDASVIQVSQGGFYEVVGSTGGTASVIFTDPGSGETVTVPVTVD